MDAPLVDYGTPGADKFTQCIIAQLCIRLVDFFNMSMIIPTLSQYLVDSGGSNEQYYLALGLQVITMISFSFVCGCFLDRTDKILPVYVATLVFSVVGNGLYSVANVVDALRFPETIIASRVLVGLGSANYMLGLMYLGRAALPHERQKWSALGALTRTGGLLVGPGLTALLQLIFQSAGPNGVRSLFDIFSLPATSLCVANAICLIWVILVWRDPPPVQALDTGDGSKSEEKGLCAFLCQGKCVATLVNSVIANFVLSAVEYLVPVLTANLLGWTDGKRTGAVLMAIAAVVICSQVATLRMRKCMAPRQIMLVGACGIAAMSVFTLLLWLGVFGTAVPALASKARANWFACVVPFVLLEMFLPQVAISCMAIWVTFVVEEVPQKQGLLMAFFGNIAMLGNALAAVWDGISYGDDNIEKEALCWTAVQGIAVVAGALVLSTLLAYPRLGLALEVQPAPKAEPEKLTAQPMPLPRTRSFEVAAGL